MKKLIKQLLIEALGVPDNITKIGGELYNKVLDQLNKQIADTLILDIDNDIKLKGEYKIGDVIFNKIIIKIKTHVVRQHNNDLPKVYSMSFRNKSKFNPDLFRNVRVGKDGTIYLSIEIAVNPSTTVEEVMDEFIKEKKVMTMSLAHELKHGYDTVKKKTSKIHTSSEYNTYTNVRTNIPPLDQFVHDLYYTTDIENLVRTTEVASNLEQLDITKKQFLNFLNSDKTYQDLKRINNFSLDKLFSDLKQYREKIVTTLNDAGYDTPSDDDELINLLLKLTFNMLQSRKFEDYKKLARLNDPFVSMFLQMNSVTNKEIKRYVDDLKRFKTYQEFFTYEQKRFKEVTGKLLKKIHKLYALAKDDEQSDVMQKINARTTNESILDWDMYYEANNIGKTNPFKKDDKRTD
jgi:hypothetical protein